MHTFNSVAVLGLFLAGLPSCLLQALHSATKSSKAVNLIGETVAFTCATLFWAKVVYVSTDSLCWELSMQDRLIYPASLIITETFIDQSQAKFCCHQSVHQPVPIGWMHLLIQIFLSSFFFLGDENTAKRVPPLHRRLKNILLFGERGGVNASAAGCRMAGK